MVALVASAVLSLLGQIAIVMRVRLPVDADQSLRISYSVGAIASLWLAALVVPMQTQPTTKGALLLGMLLALLAVGIWQSDFLPNYVAYALLMFTYFLYAAALASVPLAQPTLWVLLLLVPIILLALWFRRSLRELWWSVIIFALPLALSLWHGINWFANAPMQPASWLALLGVSLLALAHIGQAAHSFRPLRVDWHRAALPLFSLGHLALVWMLWVAVFPVR